MASWSHLSKNHKSTTMTFRIEEDVMMELRKESEQRQISINTLVNQIFKRYVQWDTFESRVGIVILAKPVVAELFRKMSKDEVVDLAKHSGKDSFHDIALFMKSKMDIDSFLSWLELRMKNSSVEISHSIEERGITHVYVMKHDLGENWSLYIKTILELIFNDILGRRIDINISGTTLTFKFQN